MIESRVCPRPSCGLISIVPLSSGPRWTSRAVRRFSSSSSTGSSNDHMPAIPHISSLTGWSREFQIPYHEAKLPPGHKRDFIDEAQGNLHRVSHLFVKRGNYAPGVSLGVTGFALQPQLGLTLLALIELKLLHVI